MRKLDFKSAANSMLRLIITVLSFDVNLKSVQAYEQKLKEISAETVTNSELPRRVINILILQYFVASIITASYRKLNVRVLLIILPRRI
ncbi:protein of unknown function [Legionella fallonii LLAP-10]|uniref:Uncharacterized protein n=1 Tax=Legionella fallonii LLAP-10 TaxID=1212491 RepID=A0A098G9E1_9GAMM|nr:protein of unknown function [Legionella fallonii LLAP-10]